MEKKVWVNKSRYGGFSLNWWDYNPMRRKKGLMTPSIGLTMEFGLYDDVKYRKEANLIGCFLRSSFDVNLNLKGREIL